MNTIKGLSPDTAELKVMFDNDEGNRGTYDGNWQDYAGWTLPYLYPEEDQTPGAEMQHDYQSLGAQAVNHLANKIVMTLFSPGRPFFRLELTPEQSAQLQEAGLSAADIEVLTGKVERQSMRNMEKVNLRTSVIMALKNLIVLGNTLIYFPPETGGQQKSQVYSLHDYRVRRDLSGTVIQIITRDRRVCSTLPEDLREACLSKGHKDDDKIELYTGITRQSDGKYFVKQEIDEIAVVDTSHGIYPEADLPWLALTWNLVRGEDYGVGLVEEYSGDFSVLSQLSESVLNLASIAADIKILVNPMGQTDVDTLNQSESGTYLYGLPDDIAYLQLERMQDFQFVSGIMDSYSRRIGSAFLMNSQVTRDAERVTAEEIRLQANELESSLGGVYSRLAEEMQQPLARMLIATVDSELTKIEPVILTGVESLSRNSEHEQMMLFLNDLTMFASIPPEMVGELKLPDLARILATNRGIESDKFIKSDAEKKAEQEAAQEMVAESTAQIGAAQAAGQEVGSPQTIA
jgi:hypothetical protein